MDKVVAGAYADALSRLGKAGAKIVDMPFVEFGEVMTLNRYGGFAASEAYAWHHRLIETKGALYDPRVLVRIMRGKDQDATQYIALIRARADLPRRGDLGQFDAQLCRTFRSPRRRASRGRGAVPHRQRADVAQHHDRQCARPLRDLDTLPSPWRRARRADAGGRTRRRSPAVLDCGGGGANRVTGSGQTLKMADLLFKLVRPALTFLDPERAHGATIRALKLGLARTMPRRTDDPILATKVWNLSFPNPVGLAAGFDKHAEVCDAALALGFGFVEAGTVTPRPQPGNSGQRLYRLAEDEAVINRFGFNSHGIAPFVANLARRRGRPGIVGANVGKNRDTIDGAADYIAGIEAVGALAD